MLRTIKIRVRKGSAGLQNLGRNLFTFTQPPAMPPLAHRRNVNDVEEMVGVIDTQRAYEINSRRSNRE
jgi:flagellar basal body rod protein FlgG